MYTILVWIIFLVDLRLYYTPYLEIGQMKSLQEAITRNEINLTGSPIIVPPLEFDVLSRIAAFQTEGRHGLSCQDASAGETAQRHSNSLSAYLKQPHFEKIRLHTRRQDLAKSQVMARSRIPIPPEISFYPVFRQTPGFDYYRGK